MDELNGRRLAHIELIASLDPIPDADRIERATILGWHVVVKKGDFAVGDRCVYVEIDSILPTGHPAFEFLAKEKGRIRTIRLKKQVSQGIAFPVSVLPLNKQRLPVGSDVTEILGVRKYDPEGDAERAAEDLKKKTMLGRVDKYLRRMPWYRRLFPKKRASGGNPKLPEFVRKTDEERVQNLSVAYPRWAGKEFYVTEKVDGQSGTFFLVNRKNFWGKSSWQFGVCSRNFELVRPEPGSYWAFAQSNRMKDRMLAFLDDLVKTSSIKPKYTLVLQGELAGPGIQGNKYGFDRLHFFAFNVWADGERFSPVAFNYWMQVNKDTLGDVELVPLLDQKFILPPTIDELLKFADAKSVLGDTPREGIVLRSVDGEVSFKAISNEFLLKYGV